MKNRIMFSSIGLYHDNHPIYQVKDENPKIISCHLFYSDERNKNWPKIQKNIDTISEVFSRSRIDIKQTGLDQQKFQNNSYEMATILIKEYYKNRMPDMVLDLSTGRVPIKMALFIAGEIAFDYFKVEFNIGKIDKMPQIKCCTRPESVNEVVSFYIGKQEIPNKRDQELLLYLNQLNEKQTQFRISQELNWDKQYQVSRALKNLDDLGLVDKTTYEVSDSGRNIAKMLINTLSNTYETRKTDIK